MTNPSNIPRIDAHQHFWHYSREEFSWIGDDMDTIRRDFLPADLDPLLREARVDATVAVQARQSNEETDWLLSLARENPWVAGVVGWVPLAEPNLEETLQHFAKHPKFKGVRHVLQAEPDAWMEDGNFNAGIARLGPYSLTYDLLVVERQLPAALRLVDRHPRQPFVIDHLAKPRIAAQVIEPWRTLIRDLARRPHVLCKLSGLVTEANFHAWSLTDLRPYLETVLDAFGPKRLLFGSDWPVCTVATSYRRWNEVVHEFLAELSSDEQAAIFGGNAIKFYRLNVPASSSHDEAR